MEGDNITQRGPSNATLPLSPFKKLTCRHTLIQWQSRRAQEGESTRVERNKRGIKRKEAFLKRVRFLARSPAEGLIALKCVWGGSSIGPITVLPPFSCWIQKSI